MVLPKTVAILCDIQPVDVLLTHFLVVGVEHFETMVDQGFVICTGLVVDKPLKHIHEPIGKNRPVSNFGYTLLDVSDVDYNCLFPGCQIFKGVANLGFDLL